MDYRNSIYMLTEYAFSILFIDKKKAKFSNDRFGFKQYDRDNTTIGLNSHGAQAYYIYKTFE